MINTPRYTYDCDRCDYKVIRGWCGKHRARRCWLWGSLPDPPVEIQQEINLGFYEYAYPYMELPFKSGESLEKLPAEYLAELMQEKLK